MRQNKPHMYEAGDLLTYRHDRSIFYLVLETGFHYGQQTNTYKVFDLKDSSAWVEFQPYIEYNFIRAA